MTKVVFLLKYFTVATELGNLGEDIYNFQLNYQTVSLLMSSLPANCSSIDTIFLLNSPVLTKFLVKCVQ